MEKMDWCAAGIFAKLAWGHSLRNCRLIHLRINLIFIWHWRQWRKVYGELQELLKLLLLLKLFCLSIYHSRPPKFSPSNIQINLPLTRLQILSFMPLRLMCLDKWKKREIQQQQQHVQSNLIQFAPCAALLAFLLSWKIVFGIP